MSQIRGDKVTKKIEKYLKNLEWPSTTEDVARGVGVHWKTANDHLRKLEKEGKVKYRRVGKQNQWWYSKKYKREF